MDCPLEPTERLERRSLSGFLCALRLNPGRIVWLSVLVSLVAAVSGCRMVQQTGTIPLNAMSAAVPRSKSGQPDPAALQGELQRYADDYLSRIVPALDEYARSAGTPEAGRQALEWKLSVGSSVVNIVSGPNPTANLVDLLALATISRITLEDYWINTERGPAFQFWLNASRALETNAWRLAEGVLTPAHQQQLRDSIQQWRVSHPDFRRVFFARPQENASLVRQSGEKTADRGSVFALVGLDPTAGLDPAVREVTRTRLFAERAMYTAQHMPFLLRWQIELLADQLVSGSQVATALTNVSSLAQSADRLSRATESASQTVSQLPDRVSAERKAILDALEAQEGKLRELSAEVARTLASGEKLSTSLSTTITNFDALMKRFGVGEPASGPPDTNSPSFNILDYARTAEQIATMAQQLNALIKDTTGTLDSPALDKRIADLNAVAGRARAGAKSVLNHAFLLAAGLVLLAFACALIYRRMGRRGSGGPPAHSLP